MTVVGRLRAKLGSAAGLDRVDAAEQAVASLEVAVPENLALERLLEDRVAALEAAVGELLARDHGTQQDADRRHGP